MMLLFEFHMLVIHRLGQYKKASKVIMQLWKALSSESRKHKRDKVVMYMIVDIYQS